MSRMLNVPHIARPPYSRSVPLLVFDFCFVKHAGNEKFLTVLVGRVYPSRTLFACPCNQKGPDPYVTRRMASFFKACGLLHFTFMSDQEGACRSMIEEAVQQTKGRGGNS